MAKNILILCGGKSDEHEISLISAKCVLDALDKSAFHPIVIGISRDGVWYLEEESSFYTGEFRADKIRLNTNRPTVTLAPFRNKQGRGTLLCEGKVLEFDVVFPILHGPFGEDGTIQGLFDIVGVPYVGSNCGSSWICMDKALAKILCKENGIRIAEFVVLNRPEELEKEMPNVKKLGPTLFVKPARLGSSVGVTKVTDLKDLRKAVETAFRYDTKCLIERGIDAREIECAVLGLNQSAKVALPGEIVPSKKVGFYSYEAKYILKDGAETFAPAHLDTDTTKAVQDFALKVFRVLECDGMARIDLFLEKATGLIYLNEANTIPGFTPISMYPKLWEVSGLPYKDLVTRLIELAFLRQKKS